MKTSERFGLILLMVLGMSLGLFGCTSSSGLNAALLGAQMAMATNTNQNTEDGSESPTAEQMMASGFLSGLARGAQEHEQRSAHVNRMTQQAFAAQQAQLRARRAEARRQRAAQAETQRQQAAQAEARLRRAAAQAAAAGSPEHKEERQWTTALPKVSIPPMTGGVDTAETEGGSATDRNGGQDNSKAAGEEDAQRKTALVILRNRPPLGREEGPQWTAVGPTQDLWIWYESREKAIDLVLSDKDDQDNLKLINKVVRHTEEGRKEGWGTSEVFIYSIQRPLKSYELDARTDDAVKEMGLPLPSR